MQIRILVLFFFSLNGLEIGFGQNPITSMVEEKFYADEGWMVEKARIYEYENRKVTKETYQQFEWYNGLRRKRTEEFKTYKNGQIQRSTLYKAMDNNSFYTAIDYFYEDDLLVKEFISNTQAFDTVQASYQTEKIYLYNDSQQLIEINHFNLRPNFTELITQITFNYNNNGCLIEQLETRISPEREEKYIYERTADCQVISETFFEPHFLHPETGMQETRQKIYEQKYIDNHLIEIITSSRPYFQSVSGDFEEWRITVISERTFDDKGNLVQKIFNYEHINSTSFKTIYEFDIYNRLVKEAYYKLFINESEYEINTTLENHYLDIFDESDFLIETTINEKFIHASGEINKTFFHHFTNFCDGTAHVDRSTSGESLDNIRTSYEYLDGIDCDFKKEKLPLQIFPNPNNGIFQIKGDLLQGASTKVQVLNMVGQLIYEIRIPEQTFVYELNLSHLNNGTYVLFVQNGDYFSTEKVVIFK